MRVTIVLYGLYREKLPKEARGQTQLDLPAGSTLAQTLEQLGINVGALCVVNGQTETDKTRHLVEGDRLSIVPPIGGG